MSLYEDKRNPDLFLKQIMESEKEQKRKGRLKRNSADVVS